MGFRATRPSRSFIALAGLGLVACSSRSPTAPSSFSTAHPASPPSVTASASSASATAAAAPSNGADTIRITQGRLDVASERPGIITLKGSRGFRFDGRTVSGVDPSAGCGVFGPCQPGATVAFAALWAGSDLPGTVRLQGDEFTVGGPDAPGMLIEMTGAFVAPAHAADTASVTVPFAVSGILDGFALTGRGRVTLTLVWQSAINGWAVTFASFDFGGGRPH